VVVACDPHDIEFARELVAALTDDSIPSELLELKNGEAEAATTLSAVALLVVVLGEREASRSLVSLTELAREKEVPIVLAAGREDAHAAPSVEEYARSCAAPEYLSNRGEQHAAFLARVTEVVARVGKHAKRPRPVDYAMVSGDDQTDQAIITSKSHRIGRAGRLDDVVQIRGRLVWPPRLDEAIDSSLNTSRTRAAADVVHFGVTCPETLASPDAAVVDVWAFPPHQRHRILEIAREEHRKSPALVTQGPARVARGTQLQARLWFEDLDIPDPLNSMFWDGEIAKTTFVVKVPSMVTPGPKRGTVTILMAGIPIARLSCVVEVELRAWIGMARTSRMFFDSVRRRKAFASYASRDRHEVMARVQGLEKAGVDVFVDVKNLRSGEHYEARLLEEITSRDVFFLFWSKAASVSEWVEKEWRFALARRGLNFIDPIPLASPERVPPPRELAGTLHFDDWTVAYASAMASAPRRWWQIWRV
jgi:hypothetical protein